MAVRWFDGPLGLARNPYRDNGDGTVTIWLTRGVAALVGVADFGLVSGIRWCAMRSRHKDYAMSTVTASDGRAHGILMHRVILGCAGNVDHADGNGTNNTRKNLRESSMQENAQNQGLRRDNTSGYKGVTFHRLSGKWSARIYTLGPDGGRAAIYLGLHATPEEAARAYDRAARELYGPFALTNESLGLLPSLLVLPEPMAAD